MARCRPLDPFHNAKRDKILVLRSERLHADVWGGGVQQSRDRLRWMSSALPSLCCFSGGELELTPERWFSTTVSTDNMVHVFFVLLPLPVLPAKPLTDENTYLIIDRRRDSSNGCK